MVRPPAAAILQHYKETEKLPEVCLIPSKILISVRHDQALMSTVRAQSFEATAKGKGKGKLQKSLAGNARLWPLSPTAIKRQALMSIMSMQSFKATAKGKGKLQNSSAGDIWLHCVALILLTSTIAIGIWQLVAGAKVRSPLLISVLWAVYANIPPFLLVGPLSPPWWPSISMPRPVMTPASIPDAVACPPFCARVVPQPWAD